MEIGSKRKVKNSSQSTDHGEAEKKLKGADDDESNIDLPPGWTKRFSVRKNQVYYFKKSTGESCWHLPTQGHSHQVGKEDDRTSFFNKVHKKLMLNLAEKDSWKAMKSYAIHKQPSFNKKYPIPSAYVELVKKNPNIDIVAKLLLPLDIPNIKPLVTEATGNCLFNAFAMIFFGNGSRHIELRVRTVCELLTNEDFYLNNANLRKMSDDSVRGCNLVQYLMSVSESYSTSTGDLKESYREEVIQTLFESRFCSMIHIYAMANVLNVMIHSVYPNITNVGVNRKIHHQIISPFSAQDVPKMPVYVMWSNKTELHVTKGWMPDHFVACLPQNYQADMYAFKKASTITSFDVQLSKKSKKPASQDEEKGKPVFEKAKTVQELIAELVNKENGEFRFLPTKEKENEQSEKVSQKGKKTPKLLPKIAIHEKAKPSTNQISSLSTSIVSYSGSESSDEEDQKDSHQKLSKSEKVKLGKRKSDSSLNVNHKSDDESSDNEFKVKKKSLDSESVINTTRDTTAGFKGLKFTVKSPDKRKKTPLTLNKIWEAARPTSNTNKSKPAATSSSTSEDNDVNKNNDFDKIKKASTTSNSLTDRINKMDKTVMTGKDQLKLVLETLMPRSLALEKNIEDDKSGKKVTDRKILKATRRSLTNDDENNQTTSSKHDKNINKYNKDHSSGDNSFIDSIMKTKQEFSFNPDNITCGKNDSGYDDKHSYIGDNWSSTNEGQHSSHQPSKVSRNRSNSSNDSGTGTSIALPSYEQVSTPPWSQKSASLSPDNPYLGHQRSRSSSSRSDSPYDPAKTLVTPEHVSPLNRVMNILNKANAGVDIAGLIATTSTPKSTSNESQAKVDSSDPLKFLTGMLGLGQLAKTSATSESKEEADMEVDETEIQSKQFLNQAKGLYVVVDTNVLIDDIDFVIELKDQHFPEIGRPSIVIPWVVLQELDNVKMGKSTNYNLNKMTKEKARTAINIMNSLLESNHPRFIGQTAKQNNERRFEIKSNDDRILQCCFQFQKSYTDSKVVLLTNDKNLRNKSIVSQVASFGKTTFTNWLEKQKHREGSSHEVSSSVLRSPPVPTGVPPVQPKVTPNTSTPQRPKASNVSYVKASLRTSGSSDTNTKSTPAKTEVKQYTETDLADEILCDLKTSLRDSLAEVLEREMKVVYGELWDTIVYRKPPWTLSDILISIDKHWIAVFGQLLSRDTKSLVDSLKEHFKPTQSFGHNLKYVQRILIDTCLLYNQLEKQLNPSGSLKKTVCDIQTLKTITKSVIGKNLSVQKLSVLRDEINRQNTEESMCVSKSVENVVHSLDEDVQMGETSSGSQSNKLQDAQHCFQLIWEIVLNGYNVLSDKLSNDPTGEDRKEILEYFAKLCASIGAIHVTYSKSLQGSTESAQVLCQALDKFADQLHVENWKPVSSFSMSAFFSDPGQRTVLEGGLQQLETMMTAISGLQNYLSPGEVHTIELYSNAHTQSLGI